MNYLAVDTSGKHLTVIIKIGDKYASKFMENTNLQHSVTLMPQIEKMLLQMEESLSSIDVFCAVVGAGSFTGIRIGISTVKAFSYALGKKVLSVTSFETLAYNRQGKVVSVIDAKHDNFYAQCFSNGAAESKAEFITLEKLIEIVTPLLEDNSIKIDENTVLLTDLGLNSFDLVEMVCVIEDEFDISIPDKMFKTLITVKDVMNCIEELQ